MVEEVGLFSRKPDSAFVDNRRGLGGLLSKFSLAVNMRNCWDLWCVATFTTWVRLRNGWRRFVLVGWDRIEGDEDSGWILEKHSVSALELQDVRRSSNGNPWR